MTWAGLLILAAEEVKAPAESMDLVTLLSTLLGPGTAAVVLLVVKYWPSRLQQTITNEIGDGTKKEKDLIAMVVDNDKKVALLEAKCTELEKRMDRDK